ncbi:MAG: FAD-dependent oxidoreductase [Candidatus Methylacidiphilales bacterium]|nr:FAD-dependent oxidoreductase [Candidatus Methylacidiphilales bacterium]
MISHSIDCDLLVAGGGLAGVCAALSAARNGARVVLVQDRSVLGGNASSEIKMHVVGADCHGAKPGCRESGLMEELRLEDAARNPAGVYSQWDLLLYEKVILEPNIRLLLDTDVIGVEVADQVIQSARAVRLSTEDEFIIRARFFADCTGDGRLGAEAGADYHVGREGKADYGESLAQEKADRQTLGSSILLTGRKHDTPQPFVRPSWVRTFKKEDFKLRPIKSFEYGYWWFEWGGQLDTLKDNAEIRHELMRITLGVWDYIKNSGEFPEAANWGLEWVGSIPGKRESRRFYGTYRLTEMDVLKPGHFDDTVAYGGWFVDTHPPMGVDAPEEPPCIQHHFDHLFPLPLRCYHSRNIANLFFAGRNISATHIAFASTRVMATCAVGGQAVGTAAALWLHEKTNDIRSLSTPENIRALQQRLLRDDAFLLDLRNEDPADLARTASARASSGSNTAALALDGVTRDLRAAFGSWSSDSVHAWTSAELPASLALELAKPAPIREIHVTFDSGFEKELLLTPSHHHQKISAPRGPQTKLVRHYRLKIDGVVVHEETHNILRKRVHRLPAAVSGQTVEVECLATHGAPVARIFEVRSYAN